MELGTIVQGLLLPRWVLLRKTIAFQSKFGKNWSRKALDKKSLLLSSKGTKAALLLVQGAFVIKIWADIAVEYAVWAIFNHSHFWVRQSWFFAKFSKLDLLVLFSLNPVQHFTKNLSQKQIEQTQNHSSVWGYYSLWLPRSKHHFLSLPFLKLV